MEASSDAGRTWTYPQQPHRSHIPNRIYFCLEDGRTRIIAVRTILLHDREFVASCGFIECRISRQRTLLSVATITRNAVPSSSSSPPYSWYASYSDPTSPLAFFFSSPQDWQRYVRTWFNQPAKKVARRAARLAKAKATAPRPIGQLRPIVRGQTLKYNSKVRAGRGFTLDELRAAKVNVNEARGLGISVDYRRKNRNAEALALNVDRLKAYRAKLVVFPRNATSKRIKKGDTAKEARANIASQQSIEATFPATVKAAKLKARKITTAERDATVTAVLRKARTDALLAGRRAKRAADKAAAAAGKKKQGDDAADAE